MLGRLTLGAVCVCSPCLSIPQPSSPDNLLPSRRRGGPGDDGVRLAGSPRSAAVRTRSAVPAATGVWLALGVPPSPPETARAALLALPLVAALRVRAGPRRRV